MLTQPYKEYGFAHNDISYVFKQSTTGFSGIMETGAFGRGTVSLDPSASGRDHFASINSNGFTILKTGYYAVTAQFLLYLKFNPSNGSSFLMTLGIGSTQVQLGYNSYSGGTYTGIVNNFLLCDYPYLSASPLASQVMTAALITTTTFEVRGLCSYHSTKLRLSSGDTIRFSKVFNGSTTFDWIMNGGIWVEKLS